MALPTLAGVYVTALVAAAIGVGGEPGCGELAVVAPNLMLVGALLGDRLLPDPHPARQPPAAGRLVALRASRSRSSSRPAR